MALRSVLVEKTEDGISMSVGDSGCRFELLRKCDYINRQAIVEAEGKQLGRFTFQLDLSEEVCRNCSLRAIASAMRDIGHTITSQTTLSVLLSAAGTPQEKLELVNRLTAGEFAKLMQRAESDYSPCPKCMPICEEGKKRKKKKSSDDRDNDVI